MLVYRCWHTQVRAYRSWDLPKLSLMIETGLAEGMGFEPMTPISQSKHLAGARTRPLCDPSSVPLPIYQTGHQATILTGIVQGKPRMCLAANTFINSPAARLVSTTPASRRGRGTAGRMQELLLFLEIWSVSPAGNWQRVGLVLVIPASGGSH